MEQIDWNEFVVVETIDLFDNEDLPAPEMQNELGIFSIFIHHLSRHPTKTRR